MKDETIDKLNSMSEKKIIAIMAAVFGFIWLLAQFSERLGAVLTILTFAWMLYFIAQSKCLRRCREEQAILESKWRQKLREEQAEMRLGMDDDT